MENKCCEKCRIYNFETNTKGADCSLPGCECHTSPKEECNDKDDMFARTNEGDGYMQCQIHLRNSIKCDRLHKHLVSSPKEEYCGFCDSSNGHLKECPDSPKEEIINDWESELKKLLDDSRTGLKDSSDTNKTRYAILELFSSTEKRVANEIIGEIKRYSYETKVDGRFMKLTEIINLIKPKYE